MHGRRRRGWWQRGGGVYRERIHVLLRVVRDEQWHLVQSRLRGGSCAAVLPQHGGAGARLSVHLPPGRLRAMALHAERELIKLQLRLQPEPRLFERPLRHRLSGGRQPSHLLRDRLRMLLHHKQLLPQRLAGRFLCDATRRGPQREPLSGGHVVDLQLPRRHRAVQSDHVHRSGARVLHLRGMRAVVPHVRQQRVPASL